MAFQAGGQRPAPRPGPGTPEAAHDYLRDYAVLLDSVPFPSLVVDHRWDVLLTNGAFRTLFQGVEPHPTAHPGANFLRFVLFHPDAATVLGDHEASWCLPMLADFSATAERHPRDPVLHAVRRDIAQDPIMDAAFRHGLPHWLRAVGGRAAGHDGSVRPLLHPDPRRGATECRLLVETTSVLDETECRRVTFVLRERPRPAGRDRRSRRAASHLRVVPSED
ncbi:hypothetical protein ROS62_02720 [Streptomyces sp. DSM 41972]|uniref:MmyB-like transcription regulator ligand binding domain-containing protein n=1 Tax=Streptomyces althioticus subsp. attaecolombicae TaxID=3075534 RepID=A0ABU3HT27_9ACTN|nr:hypothetical protein [Streptomyces sp. DSM 41972]SCE13356.1 hypothetical protein GA0115238_156912 [Streptomyces sp. di50b]SCE50568.1 hypothetical protein GA0115245_144622 [Streptomyces sp. di188]